MSDRQSRLEWLKNYQRNRRVSNHPIASEEYKKDIEMYAKIFEHQMAERRQHEEERRRQEEERRRQEEEQRRQDDIERSKLLDKLIEASKMNDVARVRELLDPQYSLTVYLPLMSAIEQGSLESFRLLLPHFHAFHRSDYQTMFREMIKHTRLEMLEDFLDQSKINLDMIWRSSIINDNVVVFKHFFTPEDLRHVDVIPRTFLQDVDIFQWLMDVEHPMIIPFLGMLYRQGLDYLTLGTLEPESLRWRILKQQIAKFHF